MLEKVLEDERKTVKTWTGSGKKVHGIITNKNWKRCLGYEYDIKNANTENKITLTTLVKFLSTGTNEPKSTFEIGSTSKYKKKRNLLSHQRRLTRKPLSLLRKERTLDFCLKENLKRNYLRSLTNLK